MFKQLYFLVSLTFFMNPIFSQNNDSLYISGLNAIEKKQYNKAIELFESSLNQNPKDAKTYFQLGYCHLMNNKASVSLVYFNKSLLLDTTLYEAYFNRALAHQSLNNFTFAEADFLTYYQLSKSEQTHISLSMLYEQMQDYPSAIFSISKYINSHPKHIESYKKRAALFIEIDSLNAALNDYNKCFSLSPNDSSLYLLKGNAYYNRGEFNEAINNYNIALLNTNTSNEALENRADAYTALKKYEDAILDYQKLSKLKPNNPDYFFNIGFCYLQLNDFNQAVANFTQSLINDYSELGLLLFYRGIAYHNLKLNEEACSDWRKSNQIGYTKAKDFLTQHCQ